MNPTDLNDIFSTIFEAQDAGELKWKPDNDESNDFSATIVFTDSLGRETRIPALLFSTMTEDGFRIGYLALGERLDTPSLNTNDPRVRRLYEQVTGESWPVIHLH